MRLSIVLVFLSGCVFQNASLAQKLRDAVEGINEQARWSRFDLAVENVTPTYRPEYAALRHKWGRSIQIADTEVVQMRLADDRGGAVSVVVVQWYSYDTMTLRQTTIRQQWDRSGDRFALASERVVAGDETLLEEPPEDEEDDGLDIDVK
jgi:hypothetical protein